MLLTHVQTVDQQLHLNPGDAYFGDQPLELKTVLGSCIAVLVWHKKLHIGGMCHYLLPSRIKKTDTFPDGHYADEVFPWLLKNIVKKQTQPLDYRVYLVGGARMFPWPDSHQEMLASEASYSSFSRQDQLAIRKKVLPTMLVGQANIDFAQQFLKKSGFCIDGEDIAGTESRSVSLNLANGDCHIYHYQMIDNRIHKQVINI